MTVLTSENTQMMHMQSPIMPSLNLGLNCTPVIVGL